ncbi:DUF6912 family protein [Microlunatus kandeliicorticis]
MIFVPLARADAERLRDAGPAGARDGVRGFAATASLVRAHGLGPKDEDEAAYTAQAYAMTAGLLAGVWPDGDRVVLAAEVADGSVTDEHSDLGEVRADGLGWSVVAAVFSDGPEPDPTARPAVIAAAAALAGTALEDAVDRPEVEQLLEQHDLLWHVPDERW